MFTFRNKTPPCRSFLSQGQFHQRTRSSFYASRSQKHEKDSQVKQLFSAFGICSHKSCLQNVGEIDPNVNFRALLETCLLFIHLRLHGAVLLFVPDALLLLRAAAGPRLIHAIQGFSSYSWSAHHRCFSKDIVERVIQKVLMDF